jgi:hypothetical protein
MSVVGTEEGEPEEALSVSGPALVRRFAVGGEAAAVDAFGEAGEAFPGEVRARFTRMRFDMMEGRYWMDGNDRHRFG